MQWVTRQNIKHFEKLIEREHDPDNLALLKCLLQDEHHKLAALNGQGMTIRPARAGVKADT